MSDAAPMLTEREQAIVLIGNDRLKPGDAAVLLEGDGFSRVDEVVRLYREHWVRNVVFSGGVTRPERGSYPHQTIVPTLIREGVPEEHIFVEDRSQSTREQASEVLGLAESHHWNRILLVASHYHQYRAYLTFLKVVLEKRNSVEVINAPARQAEWFTHTEWGVRFDLLQTEFEKIEEYRERAHIATYREAIEYQRWKETRT
jgi:uncharacterized SAM-binding protein YcdF (DUF218 family)